jgi:hypothetical protein
VFTAVALYLDAGIPLVAVRAQRHFSAAVWVLMSCVALAASYIAVKSWREIAARRRNVPTSSGK